MTRWLRFLRTVMALCAVVAYATPVAAHHAPAAHAHPVSQDGAPCAGHDDDSRHQANQHQDAAVAFGTHAKAPEAPSKCPAHKDGSVSCCVAMCHPALSMLDWVAPWAPQLRVSSDSRIVDLVGPTFVTRLDRPPKAGIALIG